MHTNSMPAYWSKWESLFGSARFLTIFLNFLSVRTTTMGTGEFEKRSFNKLPKPGAPNATSQACIVPRWSLVITTVESGAGQPQLNFKLLFFDRFSDRFPVQTRSSTTSICGSPLVPNRISFVGNPR
ncbi:hypothetical protein BDR06DRAFT_791043 [Suillus hirtellus]|nr:hypothetical protein BDR06DRAFT_791043 [Suillus hirtellus]